MIETHESSEQRERRHRNIYYKSQVDEMLPYTLPEFRQSIPNAALMLTENYFKRGYKDDLREGFWDEEDLAFLSLGPETQRQQDYQQPSPQRARNQEDPPFHLGL